MVYTTKISAFVDENNLKTSKKFASVVLKTQVKALRHDVHLCTLIKSYSCLTYST